MLLKRNMCAVQSFGPCIGLVIFFAPVLLCALDQAPEDAERLLAKAIQTGDPVLLKKAAAGLKQGEQGASNVEHTVLRAERAAALALIEDRRQRINLEVMGLAARASLGDAKALETLNAYAKAKVAPMPPRPPGAEGMLPGNQKADPAALEYQKKVQARNETSWFKFTALRALGGLQAPGMAELVMQELKGGEDDVAPEAQNLVRAALLSAPESGWNELIQFVSSDAPFATRVSVFQQVLGLANPNALSFMPTVRTGLEAHLAEALPKDALQQVDKAVVALVRDYRAPKEPQPMRMGGPEDTLLFLLQKVGSGADLIAALNEMKGKLAGPNADSQKQQIDAVIKLKQEAKAQVPPPPPEPKF